MLTAKVPLLMTAVVWSVCSCTSGSSTPVDPEQGGQIIDLSNTIGNAQRTMALAERAEDVVIGPCMAQRGFQYVAVPLIDRPLDGQQFFVGEVSSDEAASRGYSRYVDSPYFMPDELPIGASVDDGGQDEPSPPSGEQNPQDSARLANDRYFNALSDVEQDAYLQALEGEGDAEAIQLDSGLAISLGGCVGEARRKIHGEAVLDVFDTFDKVQALGFLVGGDQDLANAEKQWQLCMADAGHDVASPQDAIRKGLELRGDAVQAPQEEKQLAISDVACQEAADLAAEVIRAYNQAEISAVAENEQLLTTWRGLEEDTLERAGDIMGLQLTRIDAQAE